MSSYDEKSVDRNDIDDKEHLDNEKLNELDGEENEIESVDMCLKGDLNKWPNRPTKIFIIELTKVFKFCKRATPTIEMWRRIQLKLARCGYRYSIQACQQKFKNLKQTYKRNVQRLDEEGKQINLWPHFSLMDKLMEASGLRDKDRDGDVQSSWTHESISLLIETRGKLETKDFENRKLLWAEVQKILKEAGYDIPLLEIEEKYRNLKTVYVRNVRKEKINGRTTNWRYFKLLDKFLGDEVRGRIYRNQGNQNMLSPRTRSAVINSPQYAAASDSIISNVDRSLRSKLNPKKESINIGRACENKNLSTEFEHFDIECGSPVNPALLEDTTINFDRYMYQQNDSSEEDEEHTSEKNKFFAFLERRRQDDLKQVKIENRLLERIVKAQEERNLILKELINQKRFSS